MEVRGHSVVYVGWGEQVHAALSFDDTPLAEARAMIEALRGRGIRVTPRVSSASLSSDFSNFRF
jgi:Cu2+-exporting ATPase